MGGFTILTGKEGASPKKPLFLVTITAPDGDVTRLTTAASYGAANLVFSGHTYLAKILNNDIQAIVAMSPQGYDGITGFTLTLADGDGGLWNNHCITHGWRGSNVVLTIILWDMVANAFSTDAMQMIFIGGNPSHNHARGETSFDVMSANNFTRIKVPSVPLEFRCPWDFPTTAAQRASAANDESSNFYQCGYSPDISGGVGNYASGTTPFTSCDLTRSSLTDPSVGCMARLGNAATTAVAPDGDLEHDKAGHYTARFGGTTFLSPSQYSGRQYVSGNKVFGFNSPNPATAGAYFNFVAGSQWVSGLVLAPAGDPNSLRTEVVVCVAAFGAASIFQVTVNGINVTRNNSDVLFTWTFAGGPGSNQGAGGRSGKLNGDKYYSTSSYRALGDPHGSMCVIEIVVPAQLAAPGSVPTVQVLVTSGPILSVDSGGNFVYLPPGLTDGINLPAAHPPFQYLELMSWGNILQSQIEPTSWYNAAQICAIQISFVAADGSTQSHAQFKSSFQMPGLQRQTLAQILTALRNSANMMVGQNPLTGLFECWIRQTMADQQSSAVPGSNSTSPMASMTAAGVTTNGYPAYLFDPTNIDKDSFKITTTRIESTPNTVSVSFQDENNAYQQDSITEIDPRSYAYSGNQEIGVPIPIIGAPNFDQLTRVANVQLAEALYGNPRNDPGGTLYFEFTTNQRVLHLANRLGYICALSWPMESIGVSTYQPCRLLSLKPDTDGEHWQVKLAWHNDQWYTYAYGQNPTPYQNNPLLAPQSRPPYPWRPGQAVWGAGDALFPNLDGFTFNVDTGQYPAQIAITGSLPVNAAPSGTAPLTPWQASTPSTGGTIAPDTYFIAFSINDGQGPVSNFVTAVVLTGTSTNQIVVSGIKWRYGTMPSILPYIGTSSMNMRACASASYVGSSPDAHGNPTVYTFSSITPDGLGLPDINANSLLVEEYGIEHGGVWGDDITTVVGAVLTFPEVTWTSNQWAGYILSLYYRPGAPLQPALNLVVSSSTVNTLTMASTGFLAGDVVVLRMKAGNLGTSNNTVGDANLVNWYASAGLVVDGEAGNLIQIIAGTGAWQTAKSIASNTATVFTINGTFDIPLDATSVPVVLEPGIAYTVTTKPFTGGGAAGVVATTPAVTTLAQSLLVQVAVVDSSGNAAPMQYQPFREVYIPPQPLAGLPRLVTISGDQEGSDGTVTFDTSGITPPAADVLNGTITSSQTTLTLTTGTNSVNGTQILIGTERILILAGGGTTAITNCLRGFGGTTAAAHTTAAAVTLPGGLIFTLLPISEWPAWMLSMNKITNDINYVAIVCSGSDTFPSDNPSVSLTTIILADTSADRGTSVLKAPTS